MIYFWFAAFIGLPGLIMFAGRRFKFIEAIGPVILCYISGLVLGNIPGLNIPGLVSKNLAEITVPIAIPLLLFGTDLKSWLTQARSTVLSFVFILVAVMICSTAAAFIFNNQINDVWNLAGMVVGVYTGGTPNMSAIGLALEVKNEVFLMVNAVDMVLGGSYYFFILSIGLAFYAKFLNVTKLTDHDQFHSVEPQKLSMPNLAISAVLSLLILALAVGLDWLIFAQTSVAFIILVLTTGGILLSFNKKVQGMDESFELGQYLLYIFCIAIGSMAQVNQLMDMGVHYLSFVTLVLIGSILIHLFLCKLAKVDRDTAVITSIAGIFGPAFVGPVAAKMKNKTALVGGLSSGLVGYAVGNYLGLALAKLLKAILA